MIAIVLFGKPGAGKGTQAELLKEKYNLTHISTGDVFRFTIKNETELGKKAQELMNKGKKVTDATTINMSKNEVPNNIDKSVSWWDGCPRTIAQAEALDAFLQSINLEVTATVGLEADDDILVARILERGKTSGRADDQDETKIRTRYEEYNEKTAPLIEYYTNKNKYHAVNGIG